MRDPSTDEKAKAPAKVNWSYTTYYLTADEKGNVSLSKKQTEYSQWGFEDKGTHGDSGSQWFIISNKKAPKGLKYLAVDRSKPVKKLKARDDNTGKEIECDAYRLILTDKASTTWVFTPND